MKCIAVKFDVGIHGSQRIKQIYVGDPLTFPS